VSPSFLVIVTNSSYLTVYLKNSGTHRKRVKKRVRTMIHSKKQLSLSRKRKGDLYITSEAFQATKMSFIAQKVMQTPLEGASLIGIRIKDWSNQQEIRDSWEQSNSK
jgi:hypothetical protein